MRKWKQLVGEKPRVTQPGRQLRVPEPSTSRIPEQSDAPADSESSDEESEDKKSLTPGKGESSDENLTKLCREGGVVLINYLVSKAFSLEPPTKSPKEWAYRDIARLPAAELQEWRRACIEELEALKRRHVYDLVERPRGRKVIKNRWVFDVKTDGRKKARLVAKGFSQVEGLDYSEIFSPVIRFETVRLIIAMAALEKWHMTGLDVRNAYLYGELDEELYMEQPEGFISKGQEDKVLRLLKALYGLKQAGLAWWRTLKKSMEELGFKSLSADAGLFLYRNKTSFVIVLIYVDDAIFCGPHTPLVLELKNKFMKRWECRDLGDISEFLRIRIIREGNKIHVDQCQYLQKVIERCGMTNAKAAATPLPAGYMPQPSTEMVDPVLRLRYQTVIGSLLYIMLGTRPDISFAVTKLAQYAANPNQEHMNKALYICRYLIGTSKYCLTYDGDSGKGLFACTDSDWASDNTSRRSQTGYFLKLADGIISWTSRAQKTVALSSTEAEYMALSDCSRQVVWVKNLLKEIDHEVNAIPIYGDNQGSIFIASNPVTEKRSKHIDIRYHYIREVIEKGHIELFFIDGNENPADLLTKNLGVVKLQKFRGLLGLRFF